MKLERLGGWVLLAAPVVMVASCNLKDGDGPQLAKAIFAPVQPAANVNDNDADVLTRADVDAIVQSAAMSVDSPNLSIAVLDRMGHVLRVWSRRNDALGPNAFSFQNALSPDPMVAQRSRLNRGAIGVARAAAFLSHSEAPLTSRTGQFISTFHFPAVFDTQNYDRNTLDGAVPTRPTIGIQNTPQGPLWQIDASNRGAVLESTAHGMGIPDTQYNAGGDYPPCNVPGAMPSFEGLTALPGGFPLYKTVRNPDFNEDLAAPIKLARRLVGAIGVYAEDDLGNPLPEVGEFAAINGILAAQQGTPIGLDSFETTGDAGEDARRTGLKNSFAPLPFGGFALPPKEGAVFLVGILLPAFEQDTAPAGVGPGTYDAANTVAPSPTFPASNINADPMVADAPDNSNPNNVRDYGAPDPKGYILGPTTSASGVTFTAAEVQGLIDATVAASYDTHAAIRSPDFPGDGAQKPITPCQMFISVCDINGVLLGVFRMPDATTFSLEISYTKARNTVYYSRADALDVTGPRTGLHPFDGFLPPGTAITARSLGFMSQPFYPPSIEGKPPGPLFDLALENRKPFRFNQMGYSPTSQAELVAVDPTSTLTVVPETQSGIIFFPGSAPLYRDGVLIGGIGVSGDGVEQDDLVTVRGIQRFADSPGGFDMNAPRELRCDQFNVQGVAPPYFKFPQHPDG